MIKSFTTKQNHNIFILETLLLGSECSWKFCPECGNELKQETYEDQLNKLSKEELIELLKNK